VLDKEDKADRERLKAEEKEKEEQKKEEEAEQMQKELEKQEEVRIRCQARLSERGSQYLRVDLMSRCLVLRFLAVDAGERKGKVAKGAGTSKEGERGRTESVPTHVDIK
jgi:hypothetical protein